MFADALTAEKARALAPKTVPISAFLMVVMIILSAFCRSGHTRVCLADCHSNRAKPGAWYAHHLMRITACWAQSSVGNPRKNVINLPNLGTREILPGHLCCFRNMFPMTAL